MNQTKEATEMDEKRDEQELDSDLEIDDETAEEVAGGANRRNAERHDGAQRHA